MDATQNPKFQEDLVNLNSMSLRVIQLMTYLYM
jgi:hypothetical protein